VLGQAGARVERARGALRVGAAPDATHLRERSDIYIYIYVYKYIYIYIYI